MCIPEELRPYLVKAVKGERVKIKVFLEEREVNIRPFTEPIVAKVDKYTLDWIKKLALECNVSESAIVRLALFILMDQLRNTGLKA